MSPSIEIVKPGVDLIDKVIDFLGEDFSHKKVVFPTKRAGRFLKKKLSEKLGKGFVPPEIYSIEEFISYVVSSVSSGASRPVLSELDGAVMLKKLMESMGVFSRVFREESYIYYWMIELFNMFEDFFREGKKPKKEDLSKVENLPDVVVRFWENVEEIFDTYTEMLDKENLTTPAYNYFLLKRNLDDCNSSICESVKLKNVIFAGFYALTGVEKDFIKFLLEEPSNFFLFQPVEKDDPLTIKLLEELGYSGQVDTDILLSEKIVFYNAPSVAGEIEILRKILQDISDEPLENWNDTVIVLPDSGTLIPLLNGAVSILERNFNITMGYPLTRTSIYSLFERIFKIWSSPYPGKVHYVDFISVISSPLVKNMRFTDEDESEVRTRKFMQQLIKEVIDEDYFIFDPEKVIDSVAMEELEKSGNDSEFVSKVKRFLLDLLLPPFADREVKVKDIIEKLEKILLDVVNKTPFGSYLFSREFASSFFDSFETVKNSLIAEEKVTLKEGVGIIKRVVEEAHVPFTGSPIKGLQIMGFLETRNLKFRRVIILDANEDVLPSRPSISPLFPPLMRRSFGFHHGFHPFQFHDLISRHHFYSLISGAEEVHLLFVDSGDKIPSRFIKEMEWWMKKRGKVFSEGKLDNSVDIRVVQEEKEIRKIGNILSSLKELNFSYTSLDEYIKCPYRFFLEKVLQVEATGVDEEEEKFRKHGIIVHEILEKLYREFFKDRGKEISWDAEESLLELLEKKVEEVFDEYYPPDKGLRTARSLILKEAVSLKLAEFIKLDIKKNAGAIITGIEEPLNYSGNIGGMEVKFKGIADRIQQLNGKVEIIDYKTSGNRDNYLFVSDKKNGSSSFWDTIEELEIKPPSSIEEDFEMRSLIYETVKSFQLPLYIYLYAKKRGRTSGIYSSLYFLKYEREKDLFVYFTELQGAYQLDLFERKILEPLISAILNPDIPLSAKPVEPDFCESCPFAVICRRGIE